MGMIYNRKKWTTEDKEKIKKLYMQGYTLSAIAKRYGVTSATISNRLKEMGMKR